MRSKKEIYGKTYGTGETKVDALKSASFSVFLISMPLISYTLFALFLAPYRVARFTAFMHPYRDPEGAGYLYIRLTETIHAAGLWGQGFTLPAGTLPEVHSDFILAYVVYTFGWISGLAGILRSSFSGTS